ncbi:hypothetical protein SBA1_550082 [Candidatus Sulfotelmatobacter kueseliae]|uniref:Uncharacterized protein n=1 Tax=Candidatus Sulfotelmatobacter kueseliae TaxID=2042962 RepID=A0A2U3KYP6_9BACT|nr:hypothetical protein SBA1_550082 [Candidatus Sulfotelmatobacter kueseliae]
MLSGGGTVLNPSFALNNGLPQLKRVTPRRDGDPSYENFQRRQRFS